MEKRIGKFSFQVNRSVELFPLCVTLQYQEVCLPDDHTPIFDFPLTHDTGIISLVRAVRKHLGRHHPSAMLAF